LLEVVLSSFLPISESLTSSRSLLSYKGAFLSGLSHLHGGLFLETKQELLESFTRVDEAPVF
jgi:hypothetical protein